jgi:hypothetical protein
MHIMPVHTSIIKEKNSMVLWKAQTQASAPTPPPFPSLRRWCRSGGTVTATISAPLCAPPDLEAFKE